MDRESMTYDVVIVGAGPAGLSTAIQYAKLCKEANKPISVCVLEKGSEVGAHILSGAALDPKALNELLPNWRELNPPVDTPITSDHFVLLTENRSFRFPTPRPMQNHGNFIISLGLLCRWLAQIAESMGVDIFPGSAASEVVHDEAGIVIGITTQDQGLDKNNQPKSNFQPGIHIFAKTTILAEGCRGSLSEQIIEQYELRTNKSPQTYGIGIKEIWEVPDNIHKPGKVMHTFGWPLDNNTYGGSFIYHWNKNLVSIGFVIGLDYKNPYLDPYKEFQRFKHHPKILPNIEGGKCIAYGARAINEGGWQSLPKLTFPGGMIVGDSAGFLNVPKIKGIHNAMKSGMLAAETIINAASTHHAFEQKIKKSWIAKELFRVRNIRPAFRFGLWPGLMWSAIDTYILFGYAPWTFSNHADHTATLEAKNCKPIAYPKPDGIISFEKMSDVALTNVYHEENQPCHLKLKDPTIPVTVNLAKYAGLEQRYCPAGVYEFVGEGDNIRLQINAPNCIHCKTCDIKDPMQNIVWTTPPGGQGPHYGKM